MIKWHGKIVGAIYRVKGLREEPVYLIEVDDGDRIWRYKSELEPEKIKKEGKGEVTQGKPT